MLLKIPQLIKNEIKITVENVYISIATSNGFSKDSKAKKFDKNHGYGLTIVKEPFYTIEAQTMQKLTYTNFGDYCIPNIYLLEEKALLLCWGVCTEIILRNTTSSASTTCALAVNCECVWLI